MRFETKRRVACAVVAIAAAAAGTAFLTADEDPSAPRHADLHARYADARMRLAVAKLEKAEHLNGRTPGLLTETDMRRLRTRVEVLREQVGEVHDHPHGYAFAEQRATAKAFARIAEADLAAARAVNRRQAGAVSPENMKLLEVKAEIAKLRVDLLEDPGFLAAPLDVMQMQIDQIIDILLEDYDRIEAAPTIERR